MAYAGILIDKNLVRNNLDETISGKYTFTNTNTFNSACTFKGNNTFSGVNTFSQIIQGTALKAKYANLNGADIAEYYKLYIDKESEKKYNLTKLSGYLVELSTEKYEITLTKKNSKKFFGIISTNPCVKMNDKCADKDYYVPVALLGRVPCQVIGTLKKGDELTTSKMEGIAKRRTWLDRLLGKPVVGIALENKTYERLYKIEVFVK